jgi:hypothetical protein
MVDADPDTEKTGRSQPEEPPMPEISAGEWAAASRDPIVREFVQQAIAGERKLEREGLIFP